MLTTPLTIESGTTAFFNVVLQRALGATAPPLSAYRTVYNLTTGAIITPESPITVGSTLTLSFKTTDDENRILDADASQEKRRVAIRVLFGTDDEFTDVADYTIKRVIPPLS